MRDGVVQDGILRADWQSALFCFHAEADCQSAAGCQPAPQELK